MKKSITALHFAEKFLLPFDTHHHLNGLLNQHLHDCLNFMVSATWNLKQYSKALQAGKKCYELKSIVDKVCIIHKKETSKIWTT